MPFMTKQELFNKVYTHLMTQKAIAVGDDGMCMYRAPDGKRCAIGCLIPDGVGVREGGRVCNMPGSFLESCGIDPLFVPLCSELQGVHDAHPVWEWAGELRRIAAAHNLTVPPTYLEMWEEDTCPAWEPPTSGHEED